MATLYDLKEKLAMIGAELKAANDELTDMAANPSATMEKIKEQKARVESLETRFNLIKADHDRKEAEDRARIKASGITNATDDKSKLIAAKAAFYRAALLKQPIPQEAVSLLGAQNDHDLYPRAWHWRREPTPRHQTNELIHEPWVRTLFARS